jgi:hypothetical protein
MDPNQPSEQDIDFATSLQYRPPENKNKLFKKLLHSFVLLILGALSGILSFACFKWNTEYGSLPPSFSSFSFLFTVLRSDIFPGVIFGVTIALYAFIFQLVQHNRSLKRLLFFVLISTGSWFIAYHMAVTMINTIPFSVILGGMVGTILMLCGFNYQISHLSRKQIILLTVLGTALSFSYYSRFDYSLSQQLHLDFIYFFFINDYAGSVFATFLFWQAGIAAGLGITSPWKIVAAQTASKTTNPILKKINKKIVLAGVIVLVAAIVTPQIITQISKSINKPSSKQANYDFSQPILLEKNLNQKGLEDIGEGKVVWEDDEAAYMFKFDKQKNTANREKIDDFTYLNPQLRGVAAQIIGDKIFLKDGERRLFQYDPISKKKELVIEHAGHLYGEYKNKLLMSLTGIGAGQVSYDLSTKKITNIKLPYPNTWGGKIGGIVCGDYMFFVHESSMVTYNLSTQEIKFLVKNDDPHRNADASIIGCSDKYLLYTTESRGIEIYDLTKQKVIYSNLDNKLQIQDKDGENTYISGKLVIDDDYIYYQNMSQSEIIHAINIKTGKISVVLSKKALSYVWQVSGEYIVYGIKNGVKKDYEEEIDLYLEKMNFKPTSLTISKATPVISSTPTASASATVYVSSIEKTEGCKRIVHFSLRSFTPNSPISVNASGLEQGKNCNEYYPDDYSLSAIAEVITSASGEAEIAYTQNDWGDYSYTFTDKDGHTASTAFQYSSDKITFSSPNDDYKKSAPPLRD